MGDVHHTDTDLGPEDLFSSNTVEAGNEAPYLSSEGEDDDDDIAAYIAQDQNGLEPARRQTGPSSLVTDPGANLTDPDLRLDVDHSSEDAPHLDNSTLWNRTEAEVALERDPFVTRYPGGMAGTIHSKANLGENQKYGLRIGKKSQENIYAPFASQLEWELARWAKIRGPSSTSFTELMAIDGVSWVLRLGCYVC